MREIWIQNMIWGGGGGIKIDLIREKKVMLYRKEKNIKYYNIVIL